MKKRLINYTEDKVEIPSRLYSGLVRSLAWKIEYQSRIERALEELKDYTGVYKSRFKDILEGRIKWNNSGDKSKKN